jgi:type II secretion system protein J
MILKNDKGFTLIELIIAIGFLATIAVSVANMTNNIIGKKEIVEKQVRRRHTISIALSKMTDDIKMAFLAESTFQGKNSAYLTGFYADESSLNFSTMSNVHYIKNHRDTTQAQVGYSLVKNDNREFDLVRRQTDYLTDDLKTGGQSFILVKDVQKMILSYYDGSKGTWQKEWDTESISNAGRLPKMVKIQLTVLGEILSEEDDERPEHYYELVVPVEMYAAKVSF